MGKFDGLTRGAKRAKAAGSAIIRRFGWHGAFLELSGFSARCGQKVKSGAIMAS